MHLPLGERQMEIYRRPSVRRTSSPSIAKLDGLEVRRTGKKSSAARLGRMANGWMRG
jgi:hypothetical protein